MIMNFLIVQMRTLRLCGMVGEGSVSKLVNGYAGFEPSLLYSQPKKSNVFFSTAMVYKPAVFIPKNPLIDPLLHSYYLISQTFDAS